MINLDDDIAEYSETLDKLQKENRALKETLRRYLIFGTPGDFNNLESDLSAQLSKSEKLSELMFENLLVPAFVGSIAKDESGNPCDFVYVRVNQSFADMRQMQVKDILGKAESDLRLFGSSELPEKVFTCTKIIDKTDIQIVSNEDQLSVRIVAIDHDMFIVQLMSSDSNTQSNRRDKENIKLSQMIVDAIPVPLFYKDMDGRYLICNNSYCKTILGMPSESILGRTASELAEIFPKEYADFYQEKDTELINDKTIQMYEGPIKCADGTVKEYIVNKTLIKDSHGNFIGILGVMQDIDKMIKTRRELAESENRYKTLFNGIMQPIIVVDLSGNVILSNTTALQLFEDSVSVESADVIEIPAHKFVDMDSIKMVAETGEPITRRLSVNINGKEHWYFSTMQLINDFFGEKVVQIISNDVTELKRYQTELLKQKNMAEESNNLKTIFLANIAHETRTPANIISGFVQMIQSGLHPEKTNEYLASIYKNCKKLLDIVDDIVELSKIESGQVKVRHEICSINNIMEDAFVYLSDTLMESGKPLELLRTPAINEYSALMYADNQYISQVFRKLISNAVTFTQKGYIEVGVSVSLSEIRFYVKDTGIGIPENKLKIIFERFRQADEGASRQYGGNGLGLSIANELVKRMGGTLSVESKVDEGSTFSFTIPYRKAGI